MNDMHRRLELPDLSSYETNRAKFPPEELAKYAGQFVAFSPDGARVLASGSTRAEVERKLEAAGIHPSQVVGSYVDSPMRMGTCSDEPALPFRCSAALRRRDRRRP
jgi:hypothetical protein